MAEKQALLRNMNPTYPTEEGPKEFGQKLEIEEELQIQLLNQWVPDMDLPLDNTPHNAASNCLIQCMDIKHKVRGKKRTDMVN